MPVLTWSTPGSWNVKKGSDELSRKEAAAIDASFDQYAEAWERGVSELVKKYKLPADDYLLYGFSRGAQWAHRLALRKPERFWAVNVHVSSTYDLPTPAASQCLWLVTTGDRERGYPLAMRFYQDCQKMGYPIIFKAEEGLGHETCTEVEILRDHFFDLALQLKREKDSTNIGKSDMSKIVVSRLRQSPFIADYLNQQVFPSQDSDFIPQTARVYLPNQNLADAWMARFNPDK